MLVEKFKEYYGSKYSIESLLHQSNMSFIYKGLKLDTGEPVAIKIQKPQMNDPETSKKRFFLEPELLNQFSHPNIVKVLEMEGNEEVNYFSLEYINGQDLFKTVKSQGTIQFDKGIEIIKQINSALKHVHKLGKVHRDIKSSNIMVDQSGRAVLIDFGIALDLHATTRLTIHGDIFGTPEYMSPEQARGDRDIDKSTDIYSIGIVLYEIFTGKIPFRSDNQIRTIELIKSMEPEPPKKHNPSIPKHINETIMKCIAKNPAERFEHVEDISNALGSDKIVISHKDEKVKTGPSFDTRDKPDTKATITSSEMKIKRAINTIIGMIVLALLLSPVFFVKDTILRIIIPLMTIILGSIIYMLFPFFPKKGFRRTPTKQPGNIQGNSFNDFFVPSLQMNSSRIPGTFEIVDGPDKGKSFAIPGIVESGLIRSTLGRGGIEYPLSLAHIKVYDRDDLRMISRYQLELFYNNRDVILRNKSQNTPVFINDDVLYENQHKVISEGDIIELSKLKLRYHGNEND